MNQLNKITNRGLASIKNAIARPRPVMQTSNMNNGQINGRVRQVDYSIPVPFYKNKYVWAITGLLFLLSVFTTHFFMAADIGSFVDKPYSARAFGTFYYFAAMALGAFYYFINKWNNISVGFFKSYMPFVTLVALNVLSMVFFFFIGPVLVFYSIGLIKLLLPYGIGYLLSNWVFSDLTANEVQAIKANLAQKRKMQNQMRAQNPYPQQNLYNENNYVWGDDYGAPRQNPVPQNPAYGNTNDYGAPRPKNVQGRNPNQVTDFFDFSDYPQL